MVQNLNTYWGSLVILSRELPTNHAARISLRGAAGLLIHSLTILRSKSPLDVLAFVLDRCIPVDARALGASTRNTKFNYY